VAAGAQDYCKPGTDTFDCEHGDDEFHEGECPYENDGEVSAARDQSRRTRAQAYKASVLSVATFLVENVGFVPRLCNAMNVGFVLF
jgi:hypothetical protein